MNISDEENVIYIIPNSLKDVLSKTKLELVDTEDIPSVDDVVQISIGSSLEAMKLNESKTVDPTQLWYDNTTGESLDGIQIESLISQVSGITWHKLVSASTSKEERTGWKLEEESAVRLTIVGRKGDSRVLLIGAQMDDGDYYARLPGSEMVYTVKGDTVKTVLTVTSESLRIKSILPMPYETLASASFTTMKGTWNLENRISDKEGTTENKKESEENQKIEVDAAEKNLWSQVTALKALEQLDEKREGDTVLAIHATNVSGMEINVVFLENDAASYQAVVNDKSVYLVQAETVDLLIRTIRSMR